MAATRYIVRDKRDGKLYDAQGLTAIFKKFGDEAIGLSYNRMSRTKPFPYESEALTIEMSETLVSSRSADEAAAE